MKETLQNRAEGVIHIFLSRAYIDAVVPWLGSEAAHIIFIYYYMAQ
jgi:hypothetical protein